MKSTDSKQPPYIIEFDGKLYCNIGYATGNLPVYETDTIEIISVNEEKAEFEIYSHHPMDLELREKNKITLVKENGKWLFNQILW